MRYVDTLPDAERERIQASIATSEDGGWFLYSVDVPERLASLSRVRNGLQGLRLLAASELLIRANGEKWIRLRYTRPIPRWAA